MNLTGISFNTNYVSAISMNPQYANGMYFRVTGNAATLGWTGPGNNIYVGMKATTNGAIQLACGQWTPGFVGSPDNQYIPYPCNKANVETFLLS